MKVIDYKNSSNVTVEFQDDYRYKTTVCWINFLRGSVKNLYYPSVCNIGIIGDKYQAKIENTKEKTKEYISWSSMITRCYSEINETNENFYYKYQDVIVCDEWLLYENFYEWLHSQENWDNLKNVKFEIDKDILIKGNKIYSPKTCCLVPHNVNSLFIACGKARGKYPIGVTYKSRDDVFEVQCRINGKETYLGRSKTPEEGFLIYKNYKEKYIKQVAQEEYLKGTITKMCYDAMMRYEVEITD